MFSQAEGGGGVFPTGEGKGHVQRQTQTRVWNRKSDLSFHTHSLKAGNHVNVQTISDTERKGYCDKMKVFLTLDECKSDSKLNESLIIKFVSSCLPQKAKLGMKI